VQEMNGGLFIKKKEESIKDKITNFFKNGGKYTEEEIDFGESVGREI
jgi:antitoxin MazE